MPLYEYRCPTCGEFEAWRTLAQLESLMHCPTCEAVAQKIFSPPNVNLSGSLLKGHASPEPRIVKRREATLPKYQRSGSRPWMISH